MTPTSGTPTSETPTSGTSAVDAGEVWKIMSDLVLDHERRREVTNALGLRFARIRAVRRVAERTMTMKELAVVLDIDPPNATAVVDDLETLGLVRRRHHPTDRRAKLVEATEEGKQAASKANEVLFAPPAGLAALQPAELETLRQLLLRAVT